MHNLWPALLLLLLLVILATRLRMRSMLQDRERQEKQEKAQQDPKQVAASTAEKAPVDEKLASEEEARLKQAFTLQAEINALSAEFAALQEGLQKNEAIDRECVILKEQLRIAQSYASELMRFVMAPYQDAQSRPYYVPTQEQASWAFTAAKLTLGFAKNRIRSIKSMA